MSAADITPELFVENMLRHVPFDGWSEAAMHMTATELGLSNSDVVKLFPQGFASLIVVGSDDVDKATVAEFLLRFSEKQNEMPVHQKIRELLLIRFEILQQHKEAVRKMVGFLGKPENVALSSRLLYKTLDSIWRAAGDRSTDFNFYTKRATLGAVYSSTMLVFLDDQTPDMRKTHAFLDRRLHDVSKISKVARPYQAAAKLVGTVTNRFFRWTQ